VKDGAFFGARTMLSMVASHYDSIDLQAIGKRFRNENGKDTTDRMRPKYNGKYTQSSGLCGHVVRLSHVMLSL
jgi:hypothetical protein